MSQVETQLQLHELTEFSPNDNVNTDGTTTPIHLLEPNAETQPIAAEPKRQFSRFRKITIVTQLSGINFASSAVNGLVVVGLPVITAELGLPPSLAFWPTSVASLSNASTLMLAGSIADSLGPRTISLTGTLIGGAFMIGAGVSQDGAQLVVMRALQGVGYAMHLASSVALVTSTFPRGRPRNFAFACLGLSQPLGFSFGLVIGGVLQDAIGWRAAWYIFGGLTLFLSLVGLWALPRQEMTKGLCGTMHNIKANIDWVGTFLASLFMALLSYLLATLSADLNKIRNPESIVFLVLVAISFPGFIYWMHRQVKLGKPALIPNSLWKNTAFSTICGAVAISFGVTTSMELFASLFFQEVQHLSALTAGLQILPSLVVGVILNFTTGLVVDRVSARWTVTVSSLAAAIAPLLMAVARPSWPYWGNAFIAQIFSPVSTDILFTVGLIIISDVFPDNTQALAGAVFNTASQFGQALCVGVMQIVSTQIREQKGGSSNPDAVLAGLRAAFWTMLALMSACAVMGVLGMRKTGRVGLKKE